MKKNFAWPVTSTNREDYMAFQKWMQCKQKVLQSNRIAIWGAGIRGTEFSIFLEKAGYRNIVFVDSNEKKWEGCINEYNIISPQQLYREMDSDQIKILISTENSKDIEKVLMEKGYVCERDFFVINSNLYEKYVKEFKRVTTNEILVLGDCEFSKIAISDHDIRNMGELIKECMGIEKTKVLAMHGMGQRSFYHILCSQIENGMQPQILVLMINLDTLTGKQHLLPRSQHAELLEQIQKLTPDVTGEFEEYMKAVRERSRNMQVEFSVMGSGGDSERIRELKARNYLKMNYMYDLDLQTEGMVYLQKILMKANREGIKIIPFIPPVNYMLGERLIGQEFKQQYEKNIHKIKEVTERLGNSLLDLSYCLCQEMFAEPDTPDETANEMGRKKVVKELVKCIER